MIRVTAVPLAPFGRRRWRAWLAAMLKATATEWSRPGERLCGKKGEEVGVAGAVKEPFSRLTSDSEALLPGVELALLHDGDVATLNAAWLGCTGPTNILSFPARASSALPGSPGDRGEKKAEADGPPDGSARIGLGSLFLSVDTLRRECALYGQDEAEHARRLLAHGLAHLMGHDHGPAMDALCAIMMDATAEV